MNKPLHKSTPLLEVKLWGDLACFTRPEMKAERVSYPVMTPSAARGALESIFWRPEFQWQIREIVVLKPIRYFSVMRNETNSRAAYNRAAGWRDAGEGRYVASADRSQRHTLGMRDVAYIVKAYIKVRSGVDSHPAKYRDQFRRRVRRGQCFSTPYLGCREFAAFFEPPDGTETPIDLTDNLGSMLLDIKYDNSTRRGTPVFFDAKLVRGILHVPLFAEGE